MKDRSRYSEFITGAGPASFERLRGTKRQKLGPAIRLRAKQARAVARAILAAPDKYLVVCGDFNDTPISYALRTVQGKLAEAYVETGCGPGTTYNQNYFWFRIDHILHSSNIQAYDCKVDKITYSDHYPVWCYLKFK
jgi:endonuclease/exonuclease/phosphatase family metal-dependent hydrolase